MPRPKETDEDIAMRSVLMRLYHSRQFGEASYPARFVNGHAPQMEADGWIEPCGEGWRLTDLGVQIWAEMNRSILRYKFQYGQKMFDELKDKLRREEDMSVCVVEGCGKPRMVNKKGKELTMCPDHQRAYWNDQAKLRATRQKADLKWPDKPEPSFGKAIQVMDTEDPEVKLVTVAVNPIKHDCDQCEAKAVIEALRAKSPKLAKLIDAMQAEVEAAAELGL